MLLLCKRERVPEMKIDKRGIERGERWKEMSFIVLFYLFIWLDRTVTLPHHAVSVFSRAGSVISPGGWAEQSSVVCGALKGAL